MTPAPLTQAEANIWALQDVLRSDRAASMSANWLTQVGQAMRDHRIEVYSRPSVYPGEDHGQRYPGAGPKSIRVRDAFWAREVRGERPGGIYASGGANRSGKTVTNWAMTGLRFIRDHARAGDIYWAIAPTFAKLKDGPHRWVWEALPRSMFKDRIWTEALGFGTNATLALDLPDGRGTCTLAFKTEDQDLTTFESDSVRGVLWTEATREVLFDSIISRLIDTAGWFLIDYLPTMAWHTDRLETNPEVVYQHFCMQDNAHNLPAGAIPKARREMTADQAAVRIDGRNRGAEGVVVKEFRRERYVADQPDAGHLLPADLQLAPDDPAWVMLDVGKYTAAVLCTINDRGQRVAVDEVYTIGANVRDNAEAIKAMLARHGRDVYDLPADHYRADPAINQYSAANQATVGQQYAEQGLSFVGWTPTQSVGEPAMIDHLRVQAQQFGWLVSERCVNLIRELATWRHKTDRDGKVDPRERYAGDNHAIDGWRTFVYEGHSRVQEPLTVLVDPWAMGAA